MPPTAAFAGRTTCIVSVCPRWSWGLVLWMAPLVHDVVAGWVNSRRWLLAATVDPLGVSCHALEMVLVLKLSDGPAPTVGAGSVVMSCSIDDVSAAVFCRVR